MPTFIEIKNLWPVRPGNPSNTMYNATINLDHIAKVMVDQETGTVAIRLSPDPRYDGLPPLEFSGNQAEKFLKILNRYVVKLEEETDV